MSATPKVILSFPTLISLASKDREGDAPRSWIQLAKVGSWTSNRYGKFSITDDDLSQMLHNFNEITPLPTPGEGPQLPMDFDHLSMDPKKPGDGIAAGWIKKLELRENGSELWGLVEWTPKAADAIEAKEYRFVSPSFVKDHTHKDGTKIGTTLLAAAITNHPFLDGMAAVTLANDPVFGDVAVAERSTKESAMEVGQKVTFVEDPELTPELTPEQRAQTYIVKSTLGEGDDRVARLTSAKGDEIGWFRVNQVRAADAPQKQKISPLPKQPAKTPADQTLEEPVSDDTSKKAAAFTAAVKQYEANGLTPRDAFILAQHRDESGALAYRMQGIGTDAVEEDAAPVLNLSVRSGESFDQLAQRYALEKGVSLRVAIHEVGKVRPDLAAARD